MYNTDAMGVRIGELRRARGMTQQALADALGISGQAVSKWESGLGYPDITLLPGIAGALGVPIQVLFGEEPDFPLSPVGVPDAAPEPAEQNEPDAAEAPAAEPETGEAEVNRAEDRDAGKDKSSGFAVLSDESIDAAIEAGLLAAQEALRSVPDTVRSAMNEAKSAMDEAQAAMTKARHAARRAGGAAKAEFYTDTDFRSLQPIEDGTDSARDAVEGIHSLQLHSQSGADIHIYPSSDSVCRWEASGSPAFIQGLAVETGDGWLHITTPNLNRTGHRSDRGIRANVFGISVPVSSSQNNELNIWFGAAQGRSLRLDISGSGDIRCKPFFQTAELSISGSGDMDLAGAVNLTGQIKGSGDIDFDRADYAALHISGSGNVDAQEVTHSLTAQISGSGDVNVRRGCLRSLLVMIMGSGDVSMDGIDADEACVMITGSGGVTVDRGRVRHLTSSVSGSGDLTMSGVTAQTADIVLRGASGMTIGDITEPYRVKKDRTSSLRIVQKGFV